MELLNAHCVRKRTEKLREVCNQWWSLYLLEDQEKWPKDGTLQYNAYCKLMLLCRMENKWGEISCTLEKEKKGKGLKEVLFCVQHGWEVLKVQERRRGGWFRADGCSVGKNKGGQSWITREYGRHRSEPWKSDWNRKNILGGFWLNCRMQQDVGGDTREVLMAPLQQVVGNYGPVFKKTLF